MSGSKFSPDGIAEERSVTEPDVSPRTEVPAQVRRAGLVRTILGRDEDDDRPLPEFGPLPADPRWRIEHLPLVSAAGFALVLFGFSTGFLIGGLPAALGVGGGILVVTVGVTLTTLTIAWADVIRPELVMPVGLSVYFVKYAVIVFLMFAVAGSDWRGARFMFWGLAVGAVLLTGVQAWWLTRLAARRAAAAPVADRDPV
jgi:hypothetical protein